MIEKLWYQNHPIRFLLWPLLWPLSLLFGFVSRRRKAHYQKGIKSSYKADVPVVVVGNITAGGNGKTPVVIWLVEELKRLGYKPGVVSRGYGGNASEYPLLVDGTTSPKACGDEPSLIARRTSVPVAVDPVRSQAVKLLLAHDIDVVVTDDGLQHYALQRDIEISVVDGQRRYGNQSLIPLGPLRESMTRLNDVDFIIANGGESRAGEALMQLRPDLAVNLKSGEQCHVSSLDGLVAMAGIGHPPRFFTTLTTLGAKLVRTQGFADHKEFKPSDLNDLAAQGHHLIMTEKDAVKCAEFSQDNWWYLPVSAQFEPSDAQRILNRIKEVIDNHGSSST